MSAKKNGARRTSRSQAVRDYLRRQRKPKSAREILEAIEPDGDITLMCATLGTLHAGGHVLREGIGQGNVRWSIGAPRVKVVTHAKPVARTAALKTAAGKFTKTPASRAAAAPMPKQPSATIIKATKPTTKPQRENFTAPLETVADPDSPKRAASVRIAEDLVAFHLRGGRIERLDPGDCSQPLKTLLEYRARGRATQHRNRATNGA